MGMDSCGKQIDAKVHGLTNYREQATSILKVNQLRK